MDFFLQIHPWFLVCMDNHYHFLKFFKITKLIIISYLSMNTTFNLTSFIYISVQTIECSHKIQYCIIRNENT